jgi:hypothetical protein
MGDGNLNTFHLQCENVLDITFDKNEPDHPQKDVVGYLRERPKGMAAPFQGQEPDQPHQEKKKGVEHDEKIPKNPNGPQKRPKNPERGGRMASQDHGKKKPEKVAENRTQ